MGEVKITLTTLFELLKREKDREDLQKLDETFFNDVIDYLATKKALLVEDSDTFSSETEKVRLQIQNILKIVKDLYDRRERKILNIAMNQSRTGSEVMDTSSFLEKEKVFFENISDILSKYRGEILLPVYSSKASKKEPVKPIEHQDPEIETTPEEQELKEPMKEVPENSEVEVTFTDDIPKFLGEDMTVLGPFGKGDIASLPKTVAELLINTGKAEKT